MGHPDSPRRLELTIGAVLLGAVLSVVMGAANVYLGLKAGMTVSASIPAAVIALGVLRGILGRRSILEANLVQTAASAGESLAAGIIFTIPALIMVGVWDEFHYGVTTVIALAGGLLGVLLMIPMRRVFVVDNVELTYPEGLACAEVLRAGSAEEEASGGRGGSGLTLVLGGIVLGGAFKFFVTFLGLVRGVVEVGAIQARRVFFMGADISPALLAVGFIVGLPIAIQIFLGGAIGWLVAIPLLGLDVLGEASTEMSAVEAAGLLWKGHVRYMGVGAMLVGGVASIWRVRKGLGAATAEVLTMLRGGNANAAAPDETERNIGGGAIVGLTILSVFLIAGIYYFLLRGVALTALTTVIMVVMSFFFAAVASYIVGLVGNSNSPVSGMTITAVLGTGLLIYLFGFGGQAGMIATLGVAGVVCCVACTAGDVCNDLKTGHLVGASPRLQQMMQVLGVVFASLVLAPVLTILHEGYGGIGGKELPAPQAGLFAELVNGFFGDKELPRDMVAIGVGIGLALLLGDWLLQRLGVRFRLYVMPVAVGIYLPLSLSTPILLGGVTHALASRGGGGKGLKHSGNEGVKRGVLLASGIIAGESLVGVLLGLLAYLQDRFPAYLGSGSFSLADTILGMVGLPDSLSGILQDGGSVFLLLLVAALMMLVCHKGKR